MCKASVSLIISRRGKRLIDLVYDGLRVAGTLVEEDERKIIRVTIFEESAQTHPTADTGGQPTLK